MSLPPRLQLQTQRTDFDPHVTIEFPAEDTRNLAFALQCDQPSRGARRWSMCMAGRRALRRSGHPGGGLRQVNLHWNLEQAVSSTGQWETNRSDAPGTVCLPFCVLAM